MPLNDLIRAPVSDQMEYTPCTFPPDNSSFSALCPTAATLFFLPSVYTLLFLTALPGNALSLWVFLQRISTTSPTHIYLSHLSISNLVLSLTTPFLAAYYAWGSVWTLSGLLCQLVLHGITPLLYINIYISFMILTWVALSRFAALIRHTHASRPSACTTLLPHGFFTCLTKTSFASRVCFTVWVVAVGGIVPVTVYYSVNEAGEGGLAEEGGYVEVCYSPAVEIGGSLSAAFTVPVITIFFVFYLLVLLSYVTVLRHIRRSRRSTNVTTSHSLLGRVLRNIVVIQVVLSVCLLPFHIFKPIFIFLARDQRQLTYSPGPNICNHCHPLSAFIELKNCLLLLAALRASTDPLMYFLLDKTFRHQTLGLLRCNQNNRGSKQRCWSVAESTNQKAGQLGDGNVATATVDSSHESVL
ncbi:probable G-protein coupled receptor 82 [Siniperca chuatsi]|uniref:probable G-protein coupled receptor 82 n=1 Tax=Siniperca chuatsi TaxID=119488 RepID=UPI001CE228ED|nr:probable G-protein coupled receptor 82 [Siniperca chuatsi]